VTTCDAPSLPFIEEYQIRVGLDRVGDRRRLAVVKFPTDFDVQIGLVDRLDRQVTPIPKCA
jgi:hypothetical protein